MGSDFQSYCAVNKKNMGPDHGNSMIKGLKQAFCPDFSMLVLKETFKRSNHTKSFTSFQSMTNTAFQQPKADK